MSAIRADINRRISAADIDCLLAYGYCRASRQSDAVYARGFPFFLQDYLPHYFPTAANLFSHGHTELPEIEKKEPESVLQSCAASRGEAKTSLTVQAFALWREVRNSNTILSLCDTEDQADAIVEAIKTRRQTILVALDFPEVCGQGRYGVSEKFEPPK